MVLAAHLWDQPMGHRSWPNTEYPCDPGQVMNLSESPLPHL